MDKLHIRLKIAREESGLTQKEICEEMGIHPPTWNKYESGKSGMSAETLYKACKALNISADWLMGLSDEKKGNIRGLSAKDLEVLRVRGTAARRTPRTKYGSKKGD